MTPTHSTRRRVGGLAAALLVLAMAALPGSAGATRGSNDLSPRLAKLAGASLRDAAPATQAKALGLAPNGLVRRGRRLLVDVRFRGGALAAREELREADAGIVAVSRRYQTVTVAADPARLREIAAVPGVEGVTPVLAPITSAPDCPSGSVVSEGDVQLEAKAAREATPSLDGTGVTVGILSDSFDQATEDKDGEPIATHAADDVKSADLPGAGNECGHLTDVEVLSEDGNAGAASDEGRAMAQIVHDLAPGAELEFASAFNGEISYANNIRALASAGADVIVDDVFYKGEPFFQDGPIAVAVREVVEGGVTYFSAAGNNNLIEEDEEPHDVASWETPDYRDAGSCPPAIQAISGANAIHCLDFNPGSTVDRTFGIKVKAGARLTFDLQWDESWNGVNTDLDAYLLDSAGNRIPGAESREDNVEISQTPVEVIEWANSSGSAKTVQLVVNRFSGGSPPVKFALIQNGSGGVSATEYPRSSEDVVGPTIFGHSGTAAAISTGAVFFGDKSELETYSSRGPVRHDFGPVVDDNPAGPLGSPEMLSKPDLVATDCGKTTFFSFFVFGAWHFCGTSAAAPHAAAVAALMLDAEPAAEPEDVRGALVASAAEVGAVGVFDPCDIGAGLVEAVGAVEEVLAQTGEAGPTCEPPESEVEPDEAAAPGNWGSEVPSGPPAGGGPTTPPPPQPPVEEPKPTLPPRTFFLQRPAKVIRTQTRAARAVFLFGSNEPDVSFVCRIDGGLFRSCPERLARRFPLGWHMIKVAALDASGNGDKTPASYRFKIKKVR